MLRNDDTQNEAIAWHLRLSAEDASGEQWQAFADWLAASPDHAAAYDAVARADDGLEALARKEEQAPSAKVLRPMRWRSWRTPAFAGLAIAASILLAILLWPASQDSVLVPFETGPGARRVIALEEGSRIVMNGGTRIEIDRDNPRLARLLRGEATFFVRHDPAKPFTVDLGRYRLVDQGTVFGVTRTDTMLRVGVADGRVAFDRGGQSLILEAGRSLRLARGEDRIELGRIEPEAVTGWIRGRLIYTNEPLATIAADLSRSTGRTVEVSPEIASRRFTGVIIIAGEETALFEDVAGLLGVTARRSGQAWLLAP